MSRGRLPFCSNSRNSRRNISALSVSRTRLPWHLGDPVVWAHMADESRYRTLDLERSIRLADSASILAVIAIAHGRRERRRPKDNPRGLLERSPSSSSSIPDRFEYVKAQLRAM